MALTWNGSFWENSDYPGIKQPLAPPPAGTPPGTPFGNPASATNPLAGAGKAVGQDPDKLGEFAPSNAGPDALALAGQQNAQNQIIQGADLRRPDTIGPKVLEPTPNVSLTPNGNLVGPGVESQRLAGAASVVNSTPPVNSGAQDASDRARKLADEALARHTNPGTAVADTVGAPVVDTTGTTQPVASPTIANRTTKADPIQVDHIGGVPINGPKDITAQSVAGPEISQSGANLQFSAAKTYQDILDGRAPSVAEQQLKAAQDRAAAEQLSIAAGARGEGVTSARRNAATNIGLQQQQNAGQFAELRAKEIADAAAGLGTIGGTVQGQNLAASGQLIDVNKTNAGNTLDASKSTAANQIDVGKANASNAIDVSKSNQATDLAAKQATANNQLRADISSDDRIQNSLNLAAELQQRAAAGDQSAAVQLNSLKAQLQTDVGKFNAQQVNTANATNIEARLRAMGMDDQLVTTLSQQFIQAANANDQLKLDQIKTAILAQQAKNQKTGMDLNALASGLGLAAKYGPDFVNWLGGSGGGSSGGTDSTWDTDAFGDAVDANGDPLVMSDRRTKTNIEDIDPKDMDAFLRAVGKAQTWDYKKHVGPMAQDMAADKLAKEAVGEKGGTMNLNYQRLGALALAGIGRLNQRVEAIEGRKKPADVSGYFKSKAAR